MGSKVTAKNGANAAAWFYGLPSSPPSIPAPAPSAPALIASQRRAERRFAAEPEPITGFSILDAIARDPNVSPTFRAAIRPTTLEERLAAKREEVESDARGEDLWLARGGEA